jgi:uncharacterized membrane protein YkvA (DUF1232 family)
MRTPTPWFTRWQEAARRLTRSIAALYFACLDPRTPWYARLSAFAVVAYALSPLDLIPDPIPILGYLDDLLLLPLGIWLAIKLIPPPVLADAQARAATQSRIRSPLRWVGAALIIALYLAVALWLGHWVWSLLPARS